MVNHQFHLKISCVWATAYESMFKDAQPRSFNNIRECSKLHNFRIHQYNACGPAGYKMSPIWMELQIGQKRKPHTLAFIYREHHVHVRLPNGKYYTSVINTKLVYLLCLIAISVICLSRMKPAHITFHLLLLFNRNQIYLFVELSVTYSHYAQRAMHEESWNDECCNV